MVKVGLQEIQVSLRGYGDTNPSGEAFFSLLGVNAFPEFLLSSSKSPWQAARIEMFSVSMQELEDFSEPFEEFAARIQRGFDQAAAFLAKCKVEGLDEWRSSGKTADIFIGGWLANEQFDLVIPTEFLRECVRLRLPIHLCTND